MVFAFNANAKLQQQGQNYRKSKINSFGLTKRTYF